MPGRWLYIDSTTKSSSYKPFLCTTKNSSYTANKSSGYQLVNLVSINPFYS